MVVQMKVSLLGGPARNNNYLCFIYKDFVEYKFKKLYA